MNALAEVLQREFIYIWYYVTVQARQLLPYWTLGVVLGSTVSVFGKERIHALVIRIRDKPLGLLGAVPASLLGIASPLCMYGTVPVAASFSEKGVGDDWIAAFMMSSILLNPQLILYSAALGRKALMVRLVSCFLCGVAAGWCVRLFFRNRPFFNFSGLSGGANRDTDPNPLLRLLKNIWRNVRVTGPYFAVGILMAAAVGVPLYACGGGTIPLLLDWMHRGMSLGSAAAFMITGPATKITNLSALKIVLGARNFALYLAFSLAFAFLTGALTELL